MIMSRLDPDIYNMYVGFTMDHDGYCSNIIASSISKMTFFYNNIERILNKYEPQYREYISEILNTSIIMSIDDVDHDRVTFFANIRDEHGKITNTLSTGIMFGTNTKISDIISRINVAIKGYNEAIVSCITPCLAGVEGE